MNRMEMEMEEETRDWTDGGESQEEYYQMGSTRHK
jgi:hypothetical protein